jgi:hypothetical protein
MIPPLVRRGDNNRRRFRVAGGIGDRGSLAEAWL